MLGMRTDASGEPCVSSAPRMRAVRYVPMSNAESNTGLTPAAPQNASSEPDLAKIERDLAEIELMLERLN